MTLENTKSSPRFRAAFLDGQQIGEAWADDDVTEKDILEMAEAIVIQQGPCWSQLEVHYLPHGTGVTEPEGGH
jgi:hypothetical protein